MRARMRPTEAPADVIDRLRDLVPARALSEVEERSVAERQATILLERSRIQEPPVPQFVISALPGITVERQADWPTSGMSTPTKRGWRIVLAGDDPLCRQRFSLAHEFKHIIDDPVIGRLHAHLAKHQRHDRAERIANYFAACLLMPRPWVKRDWGHGLQAVEPLRRRYGVSGEAMAIRLANLGLYTPIRSTP